ncbi:integral membrane protein [Sporothrix brasiliensis 5110]|uniref:Integral membrane protein n=1 Tax=Sporothrix brasiliensis 5110 TaxID=1398154 RepID=A0A0C2IN34_9PEZI|nr:uncharacterized protein SPBR_08310 [Sporothrix brasiliensis 5110]KIH86417.1 integral membrane protein [Sporothrix brasiliensis 5110]
MKIVAHILPLLLPALLMPQLAAGAVNGAVFGELPSCALKCLISSLGESSCPVTNTTCMCLDTKLQDDSTTCILANCTVLEALSAKNITAVGCDQPIRSKNAVFRTTSTTLGIITGVFLVARFAYRIFVARSIGWDDWVALIATVVGVPSSIINIQGLAANGLGRDIWTLPSAEIYRFVEFFYIIEVLYFTDVTLLKLTILFFYLRIFPTQGVRRVIWGSIGFVVLYGLTFILVGIFQCHPISYYWTNWDGQHTGHCLNINAIGWANAAISIALDFWMLAIPLYQLRKLRLHWKKKLSVCFMFTVGTFILRLHSLLDFANSSNPTWDNYEVINWSTIEINVGIICACLPTTRLILVHFFPRVLGSSSQRYYNNYYNSGGPNGNSQGGPNNSRGGGGGVSRGGGAMGSRARSIPLVSTTSSRHHKGTNNTTITTINAHDEEDDIGMMHDGTRYGRGGNASAAARGARDGAGAVGSHAHSASHGGPGGPAGSAGAQASNGIMYSKSYAVEYGSEYNDEARLVYERGQQGNHSKTDLKSSRGSESSL